MEATGIICEYNPLHLGHKKQIRLIRAAYPDGGIVCLMSGNYVQRGHPAIVDKSLRAKAAILAGADLVLELPVTACLSSAEGFAREGVRILGGFCQRLCFGAESADKESLMETARLLLSPEFPDALHRELDKGFSFPAARQAALWAMGASGDILSLPNDILGVEYCKAILELGVPMEPMPNLREGGYHDETPDPENPSATAVRELMVNGGDWLSFVPDNSCDGVVLHTLQAGEQAILSRLRTMTDSEFEALPYGSEGLWRKLMKNARRATTLEQIIEATKSKRYTRTRLDRMILCAYLGLTEADIASPAPYVRVLAFNDRGRPLLKAARQSGAFPNAGEDTAHPWQETEQRIGRLYCQFAVQPEAPAQEDERRVFYCK